MRDMRYVHYKERFVNLQFDLVWTLCLSLYLNSFAYELSKPYIMYTNDQPQTVHGIWFFDDQECDVISSLLTRILATYQPEPILTVPHQSQSATGGGRSEAYDTPSRNVSVGGNAASRNESNGTDIIAKFFNVRFFCINH